MVCDNDYSGEYIVPLYNDSSESRYITPEERIAQVVFLKTEDFIFEVVDELNSTGRGAGGFGSTGL